MPGFTVTGGQRCAWATGFLGCLAHSPEQLQARALRREHARQRIEQRSARLQRNKESREAQRPAVEDAGAQGAADTIKAALERIKASQTGLAATKQRHYQAK